MFAVPGTAFGLARGGVRGKPTGGGGLAFFGPDDGFYPCKPGYVFTDTAGTVPASVDGDLIACFKPQYGGLPNLTQATSTLRPQLKNAGGGLWYAQGDGTDDVWSSASTITTSTEQLLAYAARESVDSAGEPFRLGTTSSNRHGFTTIGSLGRIQAIFRAPTQFAVTSANNAFPLSTDWVASSKLTATTVDIQVDQGTPVSAASTTTVLTNVPLAFLLPALNVNRLYGFALYQGTVGSSERTAIVSALAALQGRTI